MKRMAVWIIGLAFFFCTMAFAADQTAPGVPKSEQAKTTNVSTGKIVEITDTMLKIERTAKGTVETFEFTLEKPLTKFKVGDKVKVTYITKDEKTLLKKIKLEKKKRTGKASEKEEPKNLPSKGSAPAK